MKPGKPIGPIWATQKRSGKFQRALEEAGIIFIDENDIGGVGVRLKKGPARG